MYAKRPFYGTSANSADPNYTVQPDSFSINDVFNTDWTGGGHF